MLERLGIILSESKIIGTLNYLIVTNTKDIKPIQEALDVALLAVEEAIAKDNLKGTGFMLAKMLPLAARLNVEYLTSTIMQTQTFLNLSMPQEIRCGFILECDRLIDQNAWPNLEMACQSLRHSGIDTPRTLEYLTCTEGSIDEVVSTALQFAEDLFLCLPVRAGLFLAPLMVLSEKSGNIDLKRRCLKLVNSFLESSEVNIGIKDYLANRLKKLIETTKMRTPDNLFSDIVSLGLQAPWLIEQAKKMETMKEEEFRCHLRVAKQLVEQNSPGRAGFLLAPLLFFSTQPQINYLAGDVFELTTTMLEHANLVHEDRDGFIALCRSFNWTNLDIKDDVFQFLGIGAPKLDKLLAEPCHVITGDVLQNSLEHAAKHLKSQRPRGAYKILLNALPLASWTDDEKTLDDTLELAQKFINHPMADNHILDLFSKGCVRFLQGGKWQHSDIGRECLLRIGISLPNNDVDTDATNTAAQVTS
jgi:hypothetical protein